MQTNLNEYSPRKIENHGQFYFLIYQNFVVFLIKIKIELGGSCTEASILSHVLSVAKQKLTVQYLCSISKIVGVPSRIKFHNSAWYIINRPRSFD